MGKGPLIDITGAACTTYIGLPRRATVSDAVKENAWNVREQRSRHYNDLYEAIVAEPVPDTQYGSDIVLWRQGEDDYQDKFLSSKTWEQIRRRKPNVGWSKVVWFSQGVPRFSFITWLVIKNRLSTGDRMRSWGIIQHCTLCGERDETRDHLFFVCPYSFTVWHGLANRLLGLHTDPDWQLTLDHLQSLRVDALDSILIKMLFQTTNYHIWHERNSRRHHTGWVTTDTMSSTIEKAIRNRISSLRYRAGHKHAGLLQRWFFHTI